MQEEKKVNPKNQNSDDAKILTVFFKLRTVLLNN